MVQDVADTLPCTFQQAAEISNASMKLWQCMQQVTELAGKLYSHAGPFGEAALTKSLAHSQQHGSGSHDAAVSVTVRSYLSGLCCDSLHTTYSQITL